MGFEQTKSEYFGYGKFSSIEVSVDKQDLRDELDKQLDIFFKRGGKINELPMGYMEHTAYKFNNANKNFVQVLETPTSEIEAKNAEIRKQSGSKLREKKNAKERERYKTNRDQKIQQLDAKSMSEKIENIERLNRNKTARNTAFNAGLKTFEGECLKHGKTTYQVKKNGSVCITCRNELNKKHAKKVVNTNPHERTIRSNFNKEAMMAAVKKGELTFQGKCVNCGDSEMRIYTRKNVSIGMTCVCIACRESVLNKAKKKYLEKKKVENDRSKETT